MKPKINLMLDSGAFSVQHSGKEIDLEEYCQYIEKNLDWIDCYVNLDHISPKTPEESSRRSYDNYLKMRKRGLNPIPVFHVGEDLGWLHRMLDDGARHISISIKHHSPSSTFAWYDLVWREITDLAGDPTVRMHGLGETSMKYMTRYPWYSVDSSSWLQYAQRMASFHVPGTKTRLVARKDGLSQDGLRDMAALDEHDRKVLQTVLTKYGISESLITSRDTSTWLVFCVLTAAHYMTLRDDVAKNCPIKFRGAGGLFSAGPSRSLPGAPMEDFILYLAAGGNMQWSLVSLAAAHIQTILVSFYDISKNKRWECLRDFVYDPLGTVTNVDTFSKYVEQVQQHMTWPTEF